MKKIDYIIYGVTSLAAMIFTGCYEVEDFNSVPENVETPEAISIESNCAKFTPVEVDEEIGRLRYRISTSPDFPEDLTEEEWEPYFSGLTSNTRYYYQVVLYNRCYHSDESKYAMYGDVKSFVTSPEISHNYNKASLFASSENATPLEFTYIMQGNAATFVEGGFCFDTDPEKLTKEKCTVVKKGDNTERNNKVSINSFYDSKFTEGVLVYFLPYITTSEGTYYGKMGQVYMVSGFAGDNPYIDLGLPSGTKWFVCCLGFPEPVGNGDKSDRFYYYFDIPTKSIPQGCRMPTYADAEELANNCSYKIIYTFGKCMEITGPNGKIIYFPFRGCYYYFYSYYGGYSNEKFYSRNETGYILLDGTFTKGNDVYHRIFMYDEEVGLSGYDRGQNISTYRYNVRFVKD